MNIKKLSAAVMAAAVMAVAAPITGVLPDTLGVVASAEDYETGETFYAGIDSDGNFNGLVASGTIGEAIYILQEYGSDNYSTDAYRCTVKSDGTIKIAYEPLPAMYYKLYGKTLTVPSEIGGYTVSEIEDNNNSYAKSGCKKIVIPDTVKTIDHSAFAFCCFLEEVDFGSNSQLKLIDQWAFQDCRSLKSITIPASVETIAYGAFMNSNQKLDNFRDPNQGASFDFTDTYSLEGVTFADGSKLKIIGEYAFQDQKMLISIAIPESTDSIAANTFEGSALKNIDGIAGSYAETFANENGYTFNGGSSEQPDDTSAPDDTSTPTDTSDTFTDDSADKAADIEVTAKPNVIPKEAHFSVRLDDANTTAERIAYNCYFTYNGAEYEPTDTVTVRIPVPVAMRDIADTLKVYHLQDGKYVNMSAKVEDGYLVFDTDHFSTYIVTAENLENGDSFDTTSGTPTTSDTTSSTPTTSDKDNPTTGVAAVAAAFGAAALAGAAVLVVSKKRR